jgi:hypothetical protein
LSIGANGGYILERESLKKLPTSMIFVMVVLAGFMGLIDKVGAAPTELSGLPDVGNYNYVAFGDVDKNGYLDIVVGAGGYPGGEPGGLYVYLNQDGESFSDGSSGLPGPGSDYFGSVQVIDIDKDSNLDIIAAYESHWSGGNDNGIGIWFGNGGSGGSMVWSSATSPITSGSFDSVYCADIDGDDTLDIVGGSGNGIHAWKGSHSGKTLSWTATRTGLPLSGEYTGVTLGDLNNDDRLDIVAGSYSGKGISIYLCSGAGPISWSDGHIDTNLLSAGNTFDMYLTDFNGDSYLDLVSSVRGGIRCYLGNGNSGSKDTWWEEVSSGLPTSGDYYQLAVEDINADGKIDIGSKFRVWSNSGSMMDSGSYSWEELDLGISESSEIGLAISDLNNDGNQDIAGCGWGSGVNAYTLEVSSQVEYYFVRGTVTDEDSGDPIPGVTVTLTPGGHSTTTNGLGQYSFSVPNGSYTLTVIIDSAPADTANVEVNGNEVYRNFQVTQPEPPDDSGEGDILSIILLLIIVIILVLIVIILVKRKRG